MKQRFAEGPTSKQPFQMTYLSKAHDVIPETPCSTSPCMSSYWHSQPIRQGIRRDEIDFELKTEEPDE